MVTFMSDLLEADSYPDLLPVGLQVPGGAEVSHVATGVSASLELFERAAATGAQMLLVHHGLFYGSGPRPPLRESDKARLRILFDHDISLVAYHLALDAHPEVGNNAVIAGCWGSSGRSHSEWSANARSASSARRPSRSRSAAWSNGCGSTSPPPRSSSARGLRPFAGWP